MAVELAQAYVSIIPSARGLQSALARELTGPLGVAGATAGKQASSGFGKTLAVGMGAAAKTGGLALGVGLAAAGAKGLDVAADFQQTRIAFEGILGGADAADQMLGELRDFAKATPFEFTGLAETAQSLLGVGFAGEDIIPTLGTIGDVAATLGVGQDEIKGVVRALGQMKGKGKASAEELQQISEQIPGFSAIKVIAEEMGISTADAFDQMAKGAIPADTAIAAILSGMEKFPGASGAMDRQSKTLNGVMSTFKDTLEGIAIDFITPALPAISSGVQAFSGFLSDTLVPGIKGLVDLFQEEGLGGVFERLGELIATNAPILGQKLLDLGGKLVDWIAVAAPPALEALGTWIGDIVAWIGDEGLTKLGEGAAVLIPALVDWVTDDVIPKLFGAGKDEGAFWDFLEAFGTWVKDKGVPAFLNGGRELGEGLLEGIGKALTDAFDPVTNKFKVGPFEVELPTGIKGLATGGPVMSGTPYLVGERGPELFVPRSSGAIVPNHEAFGMAGAGGTVNNVNVFYPEPEPAGDGILRGLRRAAAEAA